MAKTFFYRLPSAEFAAEVMKRANDADLSAWVRSLAIDLLQGDSLDPFGQMLILEAADYREKKKRAGEKGNKTRWSDDRTAIADLSQCDRTAIADLSPVTVAVTVAVPNTEEFDKSNSCTAKAERGPKFDEFWELYPNKSGKYNAQKTWQRMSANDRQQAIDGLQTYVDSVTDKKYLRMGSTYLSKKTWLDESEAGSSVQEEYDFVLGYSHDHETALKAARLFGGPNWVPKQMRQTQQEALAV